MSSLFSGDNDNDFQAVTQVAEPAAASGIDFSGGSSTGAFSTSASLCGMQISYSSLGTKGSAGPMGVGWNLGITSINRNTDQTLGETGSEKNGTLVAFDANGNALKAYNNKKGFRTAGSHLLSIGNNKYVSETGSIYSTYEKKSNGSWEVTDKAGNIMIYGKTANQRMVNPDFDAGTAANGHSDVYRWLLSESRDIFGNVTLYEYQWDGNRPYLFKVLSGGHRNASGALDVAPNSYVQLSLEDRDDDTFSYASGYRVETNKRYSGATCYRKDDAGNFVVVGSSTASYVYSPDSLRSLLDEIRTYGKDGGEDVTGYQKFAYTQMPWEFENAVHWGKALVQDHLADIKAQHAFKATGLGQTYLSHFDINGDGILDKVMVYQDKPDDPDNPFDQPEKPHYRAQLGTPTGFDTNLLNIAKYFFEPYQENPNISANFNKFYETVYNRTIRQGGSNAYMHMSLNDMDGDGRLDRGSNPQRKIPENYVSIECNDGTRFINDIPFGPIFVEPKAESGLDIDTTSPWYGVSLSLNGDIAITMANFDGDLPDRMFRPFKNVNLAKHFYAQQNQRKADGTSGLGSLLKLKREGLYISDTNDIKFQLHNGLTTVELGTGVTRSDLTDINGDGVGDHITTVRTNDPPQGQPAGTDDDTNYDRYIVAHGTTYSYKPYDQATYLIPRHPDNPTGPQTIASGAIENAGAFGYTTVGGSNYSQGFQTTQRLDVNGDGRWDLVWPAFQSYQKKTGLPTFFKNYFWVCINTGKGFAAPIKLSNVDHDGGLTDANKNYNANNWNSNEQPDFGWAHSTFESLGQTLVMMADFNGDGLVDRGFVPRDTANKNVNAPPTLNLKQQGFKVQLMKQPAQGPCSDLLYQIKNGIGGSVEVKYGGSLTHSDNTKLVQKGISPQIRVGYLNNPFPIVTSVTASDGIDTHGPVVVEYEYSGGYANNKSIREKGRGFHEVKTIAQNGSYSVSLHHQGDSEDGTPGGPFEDPTKGAWQSPTAVTKIGLPYCQESYDDAGKLIGRVYTKHREHVVTNYGPHIKQYISVPDCVLTETRQGLPATNARWTAAGATFEPIKGNSIRSVAIGEVLKSSVNLTNYTFTDLIPADTVYNHTKFDKAAAGLAGTVFDNLPSETIVSSSSDVNNTSAYLRRGTVFYNTKGQPLSQKAYDVDDNSFIETSTTYEPKFGLPVSTFDPYGIETQRIIYSTNPHYPRRPFQTITVPTNATNPKGLDYVSTVEEYNIWGQASRVRDRNNNVAFTKHDEFGRQTAQDVIPNGADRQWVSKTFYDFGVDAQGKPNSCVHQKVNDGVDLIDGTESYVYMDGQGQARQTRTESWKEEGVIYTVVDSEPANHIAMTSVQREPYFSPGSAQTPLNTTVQQVFTQMDSQGRPISVTPPAGDVGSPSGPVFSQYTYNGDVWATQVTDPLGNTKVSYVDAFGRLKRIIDERGGITQYAYDILGQLKQVIDNDLNVTTINYDGHGRKESMDDPDMGFWTYKYNDRSQLINQVDEKGNKIVFRYHAEGRLQNRKSYGADDVGNLTLEETVNWVYDEDPNAPNKYIPKGALALTHSYNALTKTKLINIPFYDSRGRVTKAQTRLKVWDAQGNIKHDRTYASATKYNDYFAIESRGPGFRAPTISFERFHNGAVKAVVDAKTGEEIHSTSGWDVFGNPIINWFIDKTFITQFSYYQNTHRLAWAKSRSAVLPIENYLHLEYEYDKEGSLLDIDNKLHNDGDKFAIKYLPDGSLKSYKHKVGPDETVITRNFQYSLIGNIEKNGDTDPDGTHADYAYEDEDHVHAATRANGETFTYDANGNMITRTCDTGTPNAVIQYLKYDAHNRLVEILIDPVDPQQENTLLTYGYDPDGKRLWQQCGEDDDPNREFKITLGAFESEQKGDKYSETYYVMGVDSSRVLTIVNDCADADGGLQILPGAPVDPGSSKITRRVQFNGHLGGGNTWVTLPSATDVVAVSSRIENKAFLGELVEDNFDGWEPTYNVATDQERDRKSGLIYMMAKLYESLEGKAVKPDTKENNKSDK